MSINRRPLIIVFALLMTSLLVACSGIGLQRTAEQTEGARLYDLYCSACHGDEGFGGVGVPLALSDFLNTASDEYIYKTIRHGRPGRVMPAFNELTHHQIDAIVTHIRSWGWGGSTSTQYSSEAIIGNPNRGRQLYAKHCAYCHGINGEGGQGTGVTFSRPRSAKILAPALNNAGFLAAANDHMIKATLIQGRAGTPMRSVKKMGLKDKDINDIVHYLRTFEEKTSTAEPEQNRKKVIIKVSQFSFDETLDRLKTAIKRKGYQIIREHTLDAGFAEAGSENSKQWIIYFANFRLINESLTRDSRMGIFLPGRITLVEKEGKVSVLAADPMIYNELFSNNTLIELGKTLQHFYLAVMGEATSS
ncbi:MAG: c-type cytochrome [Candidatus Polarisedimenticolaceae bacterium]|nr:c-type cytochrome [Candidatus Polarisedimenticolaceae bacterium]